MKRELRTDSDRLRRQELLNVKFERDALAAVLDYFPIGIVVLDAEHRPLQMNRVAKELLGIGPPITRVPRGRGPSMTQLTSLISEMLDQQGGKPVRFRRITGQRRSARHAYEMLLVTLEKEDGSRGEPSRRGSGPTVVFLCDPQQKEIADPMILQEAYGLTRSEATIASKLVDGYSLDDIAEHLGVELSTARSHLKRIFSKTNTHRQPDLVRLLMQGLSRLSGVSIR